MMNKLDSKPSNDKTDPSDDAFKRFENFARKLIGVRKEEIDKADKNEQRRKKRAKAKQG